MLDVRPFQNIILVPNVFSRHCDSAVFSQSECIPACGNGYHILPTGHIALPFLVVSCCNDRAVRLQAHCMMSSCCYGDDIRPSRYVPFSIAVSLSWLEFSQLEYTTISFIAAPLLAISRAVSLLTLKNAYVGTNQGKTRKEQKLKLLLFFTQKI